MRHVVGETLDWSIVQGEWAWLEARRCREQPKKSGEEALFALLL